MRPVSTESLLQEWGKLASLEEQAALGRLGWTDLEQYYRFERSNPNYHPFHLHCPLCAMRQEVYHFENALRFLLLAGLAVAYERRQDATKTMDYLKQCLTHVGISASVGSAASVEEALAAVPFHRNLYLVREILFYLQEGEWFPAERTVRIGFPLARVSDGHAVGVYLVLEMLRAPAGWQPALFVHPETLVSSCWDDKFAEQFALVEKHCAPPGGYAARWKLDGFRREGLGWKWTSIGGASVGLALATATECLKEGDRQPSVRYLCTGSLGHSPDQSGLTIQGVAHYGNKLSCLDQYQDLFLVFPEADKEYVQQAYKDYENRLFPVKTIDDAKRVVCRSIHLLPSSSLLPQLPPKFYVRGQLLEQIERALSDTNLNFIALVGGPGVGKSTLLRKVIDELPQMECRVDKVIYWRWQKTEDVPSVQLVPLLVERLEEAAKADYVLAMIDGFEHSLDVNRKVRKAVADLIKHFDAVDRVRFLITSNVVFGCSEVTSDVRRFVQIQVDAPEDKVAQEMLRDLLKEKGISYSSDDVQHAVKLCQNNPRCLHILVGLMIDNPQYAFGGIAQRFNWLQGSASVDVANGLLGERYSLLLSDEERNILHALAVWGRPATEVQIRRVLGVDKKSWSQYSHALKNLERKFWISLSDKSSYLHSLERDFVYSKIEKDKRKYLHERAASWYKKQIAQREKNYRGQPFNISGFRLESEQYEMYYREWLYHLVRYSPQEAAFEIALHFLEAFDWWGWYLPHKPCEELIERVQGSSPPRSVQSVVGLLERFRRSYPPRAKADAKANWNEVVESLLKLSKCLKVGVVQVAPGTRPPRQSDERCAMLVALLYNFLGDAYHYQKRYSDAERYYGSCLIAAGDTKDEVFVAWRRFFLAEHYLERHNYRKALKQCRKSFFLLMHSRPPFDELDHELLAWIYLRLGDICWHQDQHQQAAEYYRLASIHAYAFQVYPSKNHPDDYTRTFLQDILSRIQARDAATVSHVTSFWKGKIGEDWPPLPGGDTLTKKQVKENYRQKAQKDLSKIV